MTVNKYNNTHHRTIKMKPVDVEWSTCITFGIKKNRKNPEFDIGNHVAISKYKTIFAKRYAPNWSEEAFVIKKVKNIVPWTYVIEDLNGEEIVGTFCEKVIKRKGDELYVKCKGYGNSFNS